MIWFRLLAVAGAVGMAVDAVRAPRAGHAKLAAQLVGAVLVCVAAVLFVP